MPETVYSVLKPSSLEYQCYRGIQIIQTHQCYGLAHISFFDLKIFAASEDKPKNFMNMVKTTTEDVGLE